MSRPRLSTLTNYEVLEDNSQSVLWRLVIAAQSQIPNSQLVLKSQTFINTSSIRTISTASIFTYLPLSNHVQSISRDRAALFTDNSSMGEFPLVGPSRPRQRNNTTSDDISIRIAALQKQNASLVGVTANGNGKKARPPPVSCVVHLVLFTSLIDYSFHQAFKIASTSIIVVSTRYR